MRISIGYRPGIFFLFVITTSKTLRRIKNFLSEKIIIYESHTQISQGAGL